MKYVENLLKFAAVLCCAIALASSPFMGNDAQAQTQTRKQRDAAAARKLQEAPQPAAVAPTQPEKVTILTVYGFGFLAAPKDDGWELQCKNEDLRLKNPSTHWLVCDGKNANSTHFKLMIPSKKAMDKKEPPTWDQHVGAVTKPYFDGANFELIGVPSVQHVTLGGVTFEVRRHTYSVGPLKEGKAQQVRDIVFFRANLGPEVVLGHVYGFGPDALDQTEVPGKNKVTLTEELTTVLKNIRVIPGPHVVVGSAS